MISLAAQDVRTENSVNAPETVAGLESVDLSVLRETEQPLDCRIIHSPENERLWRGLQSNVLQLGFSDRAYWIRVRFAKADAGDRFVVFQQQMLEQVLYCNPGSGPEFAGTRVPFREWPQKLRFPAFRLERQDETPKEIYYFRIESAKILNFPVLVFSSLDKYLGFIQSHQIVQFSLLGIAGLASLFYLGWYIVSRRVLYFYFSALMIAVTLNFFIVYGDAYMYFWPDSPYMQATAAKFTTALGALFAAFFSRPLLNSNELPRLDAGIKTVIVIQCLNLSITFIPALEAINRFLMFVTPFAGVALVVPAAWIQLRRGQLPAQMYLLGWFIILIAFLLNASNFLGWTPYNAYFVNAPVLSAPLAMICFAVGTYRSTEAEIRATLELREKHRQLTQKLLELTRPAMDADAVVAISGQSQLGGIDINEKKRLLLSAMQTERLYEVEDLRLEGLAGHVGLRSHQLSELLNQELNISFVDFVRKFRIDAAREKLAALENTDSVLEIGLSVGFGSKTAFNRSFADLTDMTPGRYRSQAHRSAKNTAARD